MVARRLGDELLAVRAEAVAARTYELSQLLVDVLGVEDVGAHYPHRVTYHPTCHSLRMLRVGDRPLRLLRRVSGHRPGDAAGCGGLLRLRRHVRGQERRHLDRDAGRQDAQRAGHRRRGLHGRRLLLPHAHRRRPVAAARRGADRPPGGDPAGALPPEQVETTFLGLPTAPRGVGHLRQDEPFPIAARRALADTQLRRNLGKATSTIRAKRAAVVGELPDWEELRAAGQAIKARTMGRPRLVPGAAGGARSPRAAARCTGPRDAIEANGIVTGLVQAAGATEVVKVKSMVTDEIGLNDALAARGHRGLRDRPGRADRAARA